MTAAVETGSMNTSFPGSPEYDTATSHEPRATSHEPRATSVAQTPAAVVLATTAPDVAEAVTLAADRGWRVARRTLSTEALWAFRGGQGAGLATALEFGPVPVSDLWAGYLLWPIDALEAVVEARRSSLDTTGESLNSCLSVLHSQPGPPFPKELQAQPVVHLSFATTEGHAQAGALFAALEHLAPRSRSSRRPRRRVPPSVAPRSPSRRPRRPTPPAAHAAARSR